MNQQEEVKKETTEKKKFDFAGAMKKAADVAKKAAGEVQKGVGDFVDEQKRIAHERKIQKFTPVTMEDFESENFGIPNVIEIVDDAAWKDDIVCENAIGFRQKHDNVEFLHLYDEYMDKCGLQFIPVPKCDTIYCVDPFDRTRFIDISCIFTKTTEEKIAELEHIASCLGATKCSIELLDASSEKQGRAVDAQFTLPKLGSGSFSTGLSSKKATSAGGKTVLNLNGSNTIEEPTLKWFAHDDHIKSLIEMRRQKKIQSRMLELNGANSVTMSKKVACAIDAVFSGTKLKGRLSVEKESVKEHNTKLIFEIEFPEEKKLFGLISKGKKR